MTGVLQVINPSIFIVCNYLKFIWLLLRRSKQGVKLADGGLHPLLPALRVPPGPAPWLPFSLCHARNPLLSPNNFTQGVANATAVRSPDRAGGGFYWAQFWPIQDAFVAKEPFCDIGPHG